MTPTTALSRLEDERGQPPYFAGRTKELALLDHRLHSIRRDASGTRQGMLLFTGVPGVGKTQLAEHFIAQRQSRNVCALYVTPSNMESPNALIVHVGEAVGARKAILRAAGVDAKISGARAFSFGFSADVHRPKVQFDDLLRATSGLSVWRKKTLVIVVDEIQGVDEQSANPMRTLHVGRHGCPIMIVGVGLQHSPGILSQHGISRMSHHQLEPLRSAESVAAIYHGLHNIGVDVDDDVAQALAKASMNFPVHVHSYIKAAATVFDEHGEVNSNFAKSRILALGKESREHYYDDRLRGIAKVNKLHPLVEHMAARDVTAVPLDMASSIIDEETIDNATRHGVLTVDHRDMTLSFGIPSFRTYMVELAQRYRRALMVGRDGNSPAH